MLGNMGPALLRSQSESLFLVGATQQFTTQQMVVRGEQGAVYSKQIFYPWQVMGSTTTHRLFNNTTFQQTLL